jgi:hypothetical protein
MTKGYAMNKRNVIIAALLAGTASGWAATATDSRPAPAGLPTLAFEEIQHPDTAGTGAHVVTPYRFYDKMIVGVQDPVVCGQKAVDPSFAIRDGKMYLRYGLTAAPAQGSRCTLFSIFTVSNVPRQSLEVYFAGGEEPFVVARLKKCPFDSPVAHSDYQCLVPAAGALPRRLA